MHVLVALKNTSIIGSLVLWSGIALASQVMYVDDSIGQLGTVDPATGQVHVIGQMGVVMTDIAFSPTGQLYGVSYGQFYSIDTTTAHAIFIGNLNLPVYDANALVFDSSGTLYSAGFSSTDLYRINPSTGAGTVIGNMGYSSGGDLAFSNGNFYLASTNNELIKVDLGNLANTVSVGPFGEYGIYGLANGQDGVLYAVAGTTIYSVNTTTGALFNPVNFGGQGLYSANGQSFFAEAAPTVPVPSSAWLFLSGMLSLAGYGRKSKTL